MSALAYAGRFARLDLAEVSATAAHSLNDDLFRWHYDTKANS